MLLFCNVVVAALLFASQPLFIVACFQTNLSLGYVHVQCGACFTCSSDYLTLHPLLIVYDLTFVFLSHMLLNWNVLGLFCSWLL